MGAVLAVIGKGGAFFYGHQENTLQGLSQADDGQGQKRQLQGAKAKSKKEAKP